MAKEREEIVNLKKNIYEHLKTRKKYNTLLLQKDILQEDYDKKVLELNTEKRLRQVEKTAYEEEIRKYVEKITKLMEENKKLKGGIKNGKVQDTKSKRNRSKSKPNSK